PEPSHGLPFDRSYQCATLATPSGLADGTRSRIVESRISRVAGSLPVARPWSSSIAISVDAVSVEWIEQVITTTGLLAWTGSRRVLSAPWYRGSCSRC